MEGRRKKGVFRKLTAESMHLMSGCSEKLKFNNNMETEEMDFQNSNVSQITLYSIVA